MNCHDREPDLLLYGLGQLSIRQRLQTEWHLLRCAACRTRHAELMRASQEIAHVVQPMGGVLPEPLVSPLWTLKSILLVAALVLLLVLGAVSFVRSSSHVPALDDPGCTPGLSSDRCR